MKKTLLAIALTVPFAFAAQTANPPAKSGSSDSTAKPAANKTVKKHSKKAAKKPASGSSSTVQK